MTVRGSVSSLPGLLSSQVCLVREAMAEGGSLQKPSGCLSLQPACLGNLST